MNDYANVSAQVHFCACVVNFFPKDGIIGGISIYGCDEDVVIGFFVDGHLAVALDVGAVLPVSACIGAEQEDLPDTWLSKLLDFIDNKL